MTRTTKWLLAAAALLGLAWAGWEGWQARKGLAADAPAGRAAGPAGAASGAAARSGPVLEFNATDIQAAEPRVLAEAIHPEPRRHHAAIRQRLLHAVHEFFLHHAVEEEAPTRKAVGMEHRDGREPRPP